MLTVHAEARDPRFHVNDTVWVLLPSSKYDQYFCREGVVVSVDRGADDSRRVGTISIVVTNHKGCVAPDLDKMVPCVRDDSGGNASFVKSGSPGAFGYELFRVQEELEELRREPGGVNAQREGRREAYEKVVEALKDGSGCTIRLEQPPRSRCWSFGRRKRGVT